MLFEDWFGTGNANYEARLGRLERQVLRRCRRIKGNRPHALAFAAAVSSREMDHWLFLNANSLFFSVFENVTPRAGEKIVTLLFSACLYHAAYRRNQPAWVDKDLSEIAATLTDLLPDLEQTLKAMATWFLPELPDHIVSHELCENMLREVSGPSDLEARLTFGILTNEMFRKAFERYQRHID